MPGLHEHVRVRWDPFAIPYITARTEGDLFFAQGYIHAQDRLWQMDLARRLFSGRLAEIFGERPGPRRDFVRHLRSGTTSTVDHFIRLLGVRHTAGLSLPLLPERPARAVEAYCAGVNACIEARGRRLPVEFRLLRYRPDPWRPVDCLTLARGFSLFLSSALVTRLSFLALHRRLENQPEKFHSLAPRYPDWGAAVTRAVGEEGAALLRFVNDVFADDLWSPPGQGSNSWVVDPARAAQGHAILCNDPHLRMSAPGIWYLNHLRVAPEARERNGFTPNAGEHPGLQVGGASLPGSPFVYIGHNRDMAWGFSAALCDDADLYRERLHPQRPELHQTPDGWAPFETRNETIAVRGRRPVEAAVRHTRHGPVLSDLLAPSQGTREAPAPEVLSYRWTAHTPGNELGFLDGINRARDWSGFLSALEHHVSPSLHCVYADTRGNIGHTLAGHVPVRPEPPSWLPLEGWNPAHDWTGVIPFPELPRLYNPPEGMVATANNRIAGGNYPYYLSDLYEPPYRIERIRQVLAGAERVDPDAMSRLHLDTRSVQAERLLTVLGPELVEIAHEETALKPAVDVLTEWNFDCNAESSGAALFHVLYHRLMWNIWEKELGAEILSGYAEILNQPIAPLDDILTDPGSIWFRELPRKAVLTKSLRQARAELTRQQGPDPGNWTWGRLHTLTAQHALGPMKWLAPFFSVGPFPAAGSACTVNNSHYRHSNPYDQIIGVSLRMTVTLSDPIRSSFVIIPGQAGNPTSPHYRDQVEPWRTGRAIPFNEPEAEMKDWPLLVLQASVQG